MPDIKIVPSDIDTSIHFWGAFGNNIKEEFARWFIIFFQERGSWDAFDATELDAFFKKKGYLSQLDDFLKNRWITEVDGKYYVDEVFINTCYRSSPQK